MRTGTDAVLTLTASDPEKRDADRLVAVGQMMPGVQDLGIFTDDDLSGGTPNNSMQTTGKTTCLRADVVDHAAFDIDENGVLTFDDSPDFEMPADIAGGRSYCR